MSTRRLNKIKKSLQVSGNLRDFRYVKALKDKGRLYLRSSNLNERGNSDLFEDFRLFIKQTEEIYKGSWDFQFSMGVEQTGRKRKIFVSIESIVFRFPELEINNARGKKHTLRELLVRITLSVGSRNNNRRLRIGDISGNRLIMTKKEFQSNYWHSHLSGDVTYNMRANVNDSWQSFCTGSGEINAYRMELNEDGMTEAKIVAFLLQMTTLVSYESVEGGPYRYIKNIMAKNNTNILSPGMATISDSNMENYYQRWIEEHKTAKRTPDLQFEWGVGGYALKNVDALDKSFKRLRNLDDSGIRTYYCLKDEQGVCYRIRREGNSQTIPDVRRRTFIFRGETLSSRIIDEEGEALKSTPNSEPIVKPELRRFLINKINNEINKKAIRQSTINRYQNQG